MRRRVDLAAVAAACSLAGTGWGLVRMARFRSARHTLPKVPCRSLVPSGQVSAVVPARDEAAAIGRCVAALCRAGPELAEVVVVDDGSTDGTAELARAAGDTRVRVVAAPPLAPGELGKPAACAQGAAQTSGEWLLFVDADLALEADAVRRLLALADESRAGLVSALCRLRTPTEGVSWLLPEVGFGLARRLDLDAVADTASPAAFAAGPCLLVRRRDYDRIGGHRAVVRHVVEDVALARLAKRHGVGVRVALAPDAGELRMYESLGGAWRGLVKNSAGVRGVTAFAAARELGWAASAGVPLVVLARRRSSRTARRLAAAAWGLQVLASAGGRVVSGLPVRHAVAAPVAELALVANWAVSVAKSRRGGTVDWRGRRVPLDPAVRRSAVGAR